VLICATGVDAIDLAGTGEARASVADNAGEGILNEDYIPGKTGVG
jgi:hypothetical protein